MVALGGRYYPAIEANPKKYIQEQPYLCKILATLRNQGKTLFIAANSKLSYIEHVMKATLGPGWHNFFDLVLSDVKKPLWQKAKNPIFKVKADCGGFEKDPIKIKFDRMFT
jgi:hypothetical protein